MGNDRTGETRSHKISQRVKASTGTERAWGISQALIVALLIGLFTAGVAMRDDLIVATAWAQTTAPAHHEKTDDRLDHLERPELLIQLAQATDAVAEIEEAAALAHTNAAAIGIIQNDLEHIKGGGDRRERMLEAALAKLDQLNVQRQQ